VTTIAGQADVMLGSGLLFSSFTLGHARLMECIPIHNKATVNELQQTSTLLNRGN